MKMRAQQNTVSPQGWLTRQGLSKVSVLVSAIFGLCISLPMLAFAQKGGAHFMPQQHTGGSQHSAPAPQVHTPPPQQHFQQTPPQQHFQQPAPQHFQPPAPTNQQHFQPPVSQPRNLPEMRAYTPPRVNNQSTRSGQQHLPEWLNNHQNLTPKQQEDALR